MTNAQAQTVLDYRHNPFGLVYEYAITENEPGKVKLHPVTYTLNGLKIAANVYTPANYDPAGKFPAWVTLSETSVWSTVVEAPVVEKSTSAV